MAKLVHCTLTSPQAKYYNITKEGEYNIYYHTFHGLMTGPKTYEDFYFTLIVSNDYDHGNGD